jgi:hypothetical protein
MVPIGNKRSFEAFSSDSFMLKKKLDGHLAGEFN